MASMTLQWLLPGLSWGGRSTATGLGQSLPFVFSTSGDWA